jgi:nucleotide-binding universal stress UspA family protein
VKHVSFKKILVGFDGSEGSWRALDMALKEAKAHRAEVWALTVEELPHFAATVGEVEEEKAQADAYTATIQREARAMALEMKVNLQFEVLEGHPAQVLVNYAKEKGFDLIVVGHSGHSGLWGNLLGSTTDKVVDHAHCCVLVVR